MIKHNDTGIMLPLNMVHHCVGMTSLSNANTQSADYT